MSRAMKAALQGAAALVLLGPSGCDRNPAAGAGPAQGDPSSAIPVTVAKPERKPLRRLSVQPGSIEAFEEAPLFAKISGYLRELSADIGDEVKKDQVLAELWIPEMEAELKQKEALLAHARAERAQVDAAVQVADAAVTTARAKIAEAQASEKESEAVHGRWKAELGRIQELAARDAVQPRVVEEALQQFRAAEAGREAAGARLESARQGVKEAEAKLVKARADADAAAVRIEVAGADRERMQAMVDYGKIRAPFDGVVVRRNVHRGRLIAAAEREPLLVVARMDPVRVQLDVPEKDAVFVARGARAAVSAPALGGVELSGTVSRTAWALDPRSRTLRVEVDVPNAERKLRPGMYARAALALEERKDALALPVTAVVETGGAAACFAVIDGKAVRKSITLGLRDGASVEVTSGLSGEENVVQANVASLRDNQPVQAAPAPK